MSAFYAVSFDCRNPKRLGYEMLRDTTASNTELYSLIKDGLKKYFEVQTDEELNEMLLSDDFNEGSTNRIPLPVFPPYTMDSPRTRLASRLVSVSNVILIKDWNMPMAVA